MTISGAIRTRQRVAAAFEAHGAAASGAPRPGASEPAPAARSVSSNPKREAVEAARGMLLQTAMDASWITVERGDTLASIAQELGVPVHELYRLNAEVVGPDPDCILPGTRLLIPGSPLAQLLATAAPTPTPTETPVPVPVPVPVPEADGIETTSGLAPGDAELAQAIDERVLAGTGLEGHGTVIVEASRRYGVPVDFVLAMLRKESSFLSPENTLSVPNRNPANLRFAEWEREHGGEPGAGNFTRFPTIADGIRAQVHLLSQDPYGAWVAARDWESVVYRWAPPSDGNDSDLYVRQMYDYSAEYRGLLGIGEDWVAGA